MEILSDIPFGSAPSSGRNNSVLRSEFGQDGIRQDGMATQDGIVPTQDGIVPAQDGIVPVRTESGQDGIGPGRNRPDPGRNCPGQDGIGSGRDSDLA